MKEIDEKFIKEICYNVLKAILIVFYFLVFNLAYRKINTELFERGYQLFTMIFLFIAIYLFEKAYKKDNDKKALEGIEILVLSAYTLTATHITNKFKFEFKSYSLAASYIFAIYFVLKSIVIYTKGRKELEKSLSDIEEIVKKEEPIVKEATKKNKEEEKIKEEKETKETKETKEAKEEEKKKTKKSTKTAKTTNKTTAKTAKTTSKKTAKTEKTTNKKTTKVANKTTKTEKEKKETKKSTKTKESKPKTKKEVTKND